MATFFFLIVKGCKNMENCCLIMLIEKVRDKDMSAFPLIFDEFEKLIYHYTAKCSAEDTYQELVVFLLELIHKIDISRFKNKYGDGLSRYITVCITNKYIEISKTDCIHKSQNEMLDITKPTTVDFLQKQILTDAMKMLTPKQQKIIIYKYIYDYSDVEIAYSLNISRQAVNRIKNRAIETLREYLK